jgi:hypothetical protein
MVRPCVARGFRRAVVRSCINVSGLSLERVLRATMDISAIIRFLEHRIADKRILRLIAKWLKVGIVEDGRRTRGLCGAPQGAVVAP